MEKKKKIVVICSNEDDQKSCFELKFVELLSLAKTRTKAKAKLYIYFTVKKLAFNKTAKGILDLIPSKPGDH